LQHGSVAKGNAKAHMSSSGGKKAGLTRQVTVKNLKEIETSKDLVDRVSRYLFYSLVEDRHTATAKDIYMALAYSIRDQMAGKWINTQRQVRENNERIVYYLSMEFYLGRMLKNGIINLGLQDVVEDTMKALEMEINCLYPCERDAGLGNGGLGRLAACFLDSMATLNIPCIGYGLRYEYGIFEQEINAEGDQIEHADNWLELGYPWEVQRLKDAVEIELYGRLNHEGKWVDTQKLLAVPHDIPIPGYKNGTIGCLRLWKAKANNELSLAKFNVGDYVEAVEEKNKNENITRVLYPNDSTVVGKELRLKQEYFLVAASIRDILYRYFDNQIGGENNLNLTCEVERINVRDTSYRGRFNWKDLAKKTKLVHSLSSKVAIQLNDTHPSLAIPELLRIFIDEFGIEFDIAWPIVKKCFYYTNHTVLPEALEKWPCEMLERVLPRHLAIVGLINSVHMAEVRNYISQKKGQGISPHLERDLSIYQEDGQKSIRMSYLSIVGSSRVNGVAQVHSNLIRETLFKNFVQFYSESKDDTEHFTNVTNGVTPRRWLLQCNAELAALITARIGDSWPRDLCQLKKLNEFKNEAAFLAKLGAVKRQKKEQLRQFLVQKHGITINADWMLSVQVKRIHEYKRQLMNVINVIVQFNRAREGKKVHPKTYIIGGKAAPAYWRAKKIIKLISCVTRKINADPLASKCLRLVMLPNYDVSTAEIVIPAADLSEQISLAGMEASGTGNMKFMMNGALTVGTLDGANYEIDEAVDESSIFVFGMRIEDVPRERATYTSQRRRQLLEENAEIDNALKLIDSGYFMPECAHYFRDVTADLRDNDWYMLIKDLPSYIEAEDRASELYYRDFKSSTAQQSEWLRASLDNIANSGRFSSDESIKNYAHNVWKVKYDA